ncbi:hypothetical protein CBM2585_B50264 [Cupriavidus taiwanensis]|nr:hypothetical protein CBM2585_B50264 [Cupriavidus taiwanensis]
MCGGKTPHNGLAKRLRALFFSDEFGSCGPPARPIPYIENEGLIRVMAATETEMAAITAFMEEQGRRLKKPMGAKVNPSSLHM